MLRILTFSHRERPLQNQLHCGLYLGTNQLQNKTDYIKKTWHNIHSMRSSTYKYVCIVIWTYKWSMLKDANIFVEHLAGAIYWVLIAWFVGGWGHISSVHLQKDYIAPAAKKRTSKSRHNCPAHGWRKIWQPPIKQQLMTNLTRHCNGTPII